MPARPLVKWLAAPFLVILVGVAAFLVRPGASPASSPAAPGVLAFAVLATLSVKRQGVK